MTDVFSSHADSAQAPSSRAFAVAPSNTVALESTPKALYIGTGGTVVLRTLSGTADVTFKNLASGQILPVRAAFVRATGTTATDIVGLG